MKAIIATRILDEYPQEKLLAQRSTILKIAVNHAPIRGDYRIFHDIDKLHEYEKYKEKKERFVTVKNGLRMPEDIYLFYKAVEFPSLCNDDNEIIQEHKPGNVEELYFDSGTIIPACDLAIRLGAGELLLLADNTVHGIEFRRRVSEAIRKLRDFADIYCFKRENEFNLDYKSIEQFLGE